MRITVKSCVGVNCQEPSSSWPLSMVGRIGLSASHICNSSHYVREVRIAIKWFVGVELAGTILLMVTQYGSKNGLSSSHICNSSHIVRDVRIAVKGCAGVNCQEPSSYRSLSTVENHM